MKFILTALWRQRHRAFRTVRRVQAFLGDGIARLPLPISARIILGDMLFIGLEATIFNTETYQNWRRKRTGRGRIHALLGKQEEISGALLPPATAPSEEEWKQVAPHPAANAMADVIIPVYSGYEETLRCIYSVLTSRNQTPFALIVINDATPDTALAAKLYALAGRDLFTLLENEANKGFVATVNRGMGLHTDRDVVLLNADTEVYGNWLDRLLAHNAPQVGSVTPLSNNAEICSYPYFVRDNVQALEVTPAELDTLAAQQYCHTAPDAVSARPRNECGVTVELPTAVGFCMFIPRAALNAVGYFDAETFGRGYGEENDFCLRASAQGFRHLLAGDVFVRHSGGASFGAEKKARAKAAWKLLKRRYPHYAKQVADFVADDPALRLRRALDMARLQKHRHTRNVLMVSHALGGGTQKLIAERMEKLAAEQSTGAFMLSPLPAQEGMVAISHTKVPHTPNLVFSITDEQEMLLAALRSLGISRLHVHHLIQFPEGMGEFIQLLSARLEVGYDVTIHDYYMFCPRINLTTEEDRYCGEPNLAGCEACIRTRSSHAGGVPVWLWRERFRHFLEGAQRVDVPDSDVARRMEKHFPEMRFVVEPHEKSFAGFPSLARTHTQGEPLTVGILGALSQVKGAGILEALLKDAEARRLPLQFVLIGYSEYAPLNRMHPQLKVTGKYRDEELERLLREHQPHVLLFPSIWPETYCYTLSHAFRYSLWPLVFDLGAQASRVRMQKFGSVLPLAMADTPATLNDYLLKLVLPAV